MPRRTRILLVEMPRMLCDILADVLSAEPDMEVVGVLSSRGKLRATVAETKADVVVLALALGEMRLDSIGATIGRQGGDPAKQRARYPG